MFRRPPRHSSLRIFQSENPLFSRHIKEANISWFTESRKPINYQSVQYASEIENSQVMMHKIELIIQSVQELKYLFQKVENDNKKYKMEEQDKQLKE
jgi:hypothetical protein